MERLFSKQTEARMKHCENQNGEEIEIKKASEMAPEIIPAGRLSRQGRKREEILSKRISQKIKKIYGEESAPVPVNEMKKIMKDAEKEVDFEIDNIFTIGRIVGERAKEKFGDDPVNSREIQKIREEVIAELKTGQAEEEKKIQETRDRISKM